MFHSLHTCAGAVLTKALPHATELKMRNRRHRRSNSLVLVLEQKSQVQRRLLAAPLLGPEFVQRR